MALIRSLPKDELASNWSWVCSVFTLRQAQDEVFFGISEGRSVEDGVAGLDHLAGADLFSGDGLVSAAQDRNRAIARTLEVQDRSVKQGRERQVCRAPGVIVFIRHEYFPRICVKCRISAPWLRRT